jgi:mono/diheme cytochrome c family protein
MPCIVKNYPGKKKRSGSRTHFPIIAAFLTLLFITSCDQEQSDRQEEKGVLGDLPSINALAGSAEPEIPPLPELDPSTIELGRSVYDEHCASCHGADLEGEDNWQQQNEDGSFRAPPHDETGHTWHHGDQLLIESIELGGERFSAAIGGTSPMPAFGQVLTDEEITAVLTYIKSTWPEDIRIIQWEMTARS